MLGSSFEIPSDFDYSTQTCPSLLLYLPPHVLWLPGNFYILSSWRSGIFSSCCLALDSSSSFPCPAFRAIAKSFIYMVYYIDRLSYVDTSLHLWDKAYLVMNQLCFIDSLYCFLCFYFIDFCSQFDYFLASVPPGDFASSCSRAFSVDLVDLSIGESGVLKSPTTSVWVLMYDLSFSNVSFTYVGALIFGNGLFTPSIVIESFAGKILFNDFVEYVFCAFRLVFFSFFCPYYLKGQLILALTSPEIVDPDDSKMEDLTPPVIGKFLLPALGKASPTLYRSGLD
ncbi:hypothetical protein STEG23_013961 [Scotinomys teguina]